MKWKRINKSDRKRHKSWEFKQAELASHIAKTWDRIISNTFSQRQVYGDFWTGEVKPKKPANKVLTHR
jgi:hypothetical protein